MKALRATIRIVLKSARKWGLVVVTKNIYHYIAGSGEVFFVNIPECSTPIKLRKGTSDLAVFEQVWVNEQYRVSQSMAGEIIIDAGANIGLAALYFTCRHFNCHVVCIEPEECNYKILLDNISGHENISVMRCALGPRKTMVRITNPAADACSFVVEEYQGAEDTIENESGLINCIPIAEVIKDFKNHHIGIVKIDIEGAEKDVFDAPDSIDWIRRTKVMIVETHDRKRSGTSKALFDRLVGMNYDCYISGDNFVLELN